MAADGGNWAAKAAVVEAFIIAALVVVLYLEVRGTSVSAPLPSADSTISRVTVTAGRPLQALDKSQAAARGLVAKDVVKDKEKAVLAAGRVSDDSGTRSVAAVLDLSTGGTAIVERRVFVEPMKRFEVGVGYGLLSGDVAKAVSLRATLARVGPLYGTLQVEVFDVTRAADTHPWNAMAFATLRF